MSTVQVFFEDCVASSSSAIQLNQTFNLSQFFFLSIFGEVVLFCKKGKLMTRIKCKTLS